MLLELQLDLVQKKVIIAYRRGMEELPAEPEEIEDAINEGVEIKTLLNPRLFIWIEKL